METTEGGKSLWQHHSSLWKNAVSPVKTMKLALATCQQWMQEYKGHEVHILHIN